MQDIFHKEDIHYTLYPVSSYSDIRKYCRDDLGDGEVRHGSCCRTLVVNASPQADTANDLPRRTCARLS